MAYAHFGNPNFFDPRVAIFPPPFPPPPQFAPPFPPPFGVPFGFRIDPRFLMRIDLQRSEMLAQFMESEGLEPSQEEDMKRKDVILQLKQIVTAWIKEVAYQHGLSEELISSTGATIIPYGSYGLGVHGSGSDIDALCVGPKFATLEDDFFVLLHDMLQNRPEVADIHCVKTAKVPLMRFKFNGILVDFPFAQLHSNSVSDDEDIFDYQLEVSDETSLRSLSGVRANQCILKLVPNLKSFQTVLRCVKLWARRRGVYSHLHGFFGGIHLAILVAYVCRIFPNASTSSLMFIYFDCFAHWQWPQPVTLQDHHHRRCHHPVTLQDGFKKFGYTGSLMPIMMPHHPISCCYSNITRSTYEKIKSEFQRGFCITKDIERFKWSTLFEPFEYQEWHTYFLKILLAAPDNDTLRDWVGWVKSRFRSLLLKLEVVQRYCDPNPTEYVDPNLTSPNILFYWGLSHNVFDVDSVREDFMKSVNREKYSDADTNPCILELSIVESDQFPKNVDSGDT